MSKRATVTTWNWQPSRIDFVFHILREVGARFKCPFEAS
jgi:hypothetical protein